jgi:F-type H+-transporting ATPase subunit b
MLPERSQLTRLLRALAVVAVLSMAALPPVAFAAPRAPAQAAHETAAKEEAPEGIMPTIAKVFNFAVLVGVLAYFLKSPIVTYLSSRSTEIRQDLVAAAELRVQASAQLQEIAARMQALPAELDALRARGAEDMRAEEARIARAASAERERLIEQTRREIEMRLRIARRELMAHAADLAVTLAEQRIRRTITPDDQIRLVDRYAAELRDAR